MHPSEAELLALIDGELEPDESAATRAHLASCEVCESVRVELEALVEANREALAALDPGEAPATTADRIIERGGGSALSAGVARYLRAASIAFLLAAAAVAAALPGSPFREAAVRLVEGLRPGTGPEGTRPTALPRSGVAVEPAGQLVIVFTTGQAAGTIEIALESTSTARIEASDAAVSFSVASDSIAVDNAGSSGSYAVVLPDELAGAEVRVGPVTVFRKDGDGIRALGPVRDRRVTIPFASIE